MPLALLASLAVLQSPAIVYTAPREHPIRRVDPAGADHRSFTGTARPGEFFVFQIAIESTQDGGPISASFTPLSGGNGTIGSHNERCISLGGIDSHGKAFRKSLSLLKGRRQVLWCGIDIPPSARGDYKGRVEIGLGLAKIPVALEIRVAGKPVGDHGAGDAKSLARLRWLDSTAGEGRSILKPYLPVRLRGRTILILGRELRLGENGLPAQIVSHFSGSNTHIVPTGQNVLAAPFAFSIDRGTAFQAVSASGFQPEVQRPEASATHRLEGDATPHLSFGSDHGTAFQAVSVSGFQPEVQRLEASATHRLEGDATPHLSFDSDHGTAFQAVSASGFQPEVQRPEASATHRLEGDATNRLTGLNTDGYQANWTSATNGPGYKIATKGRLDFTGSGQIAIHLTAERDLNLSDIRLDIPYAKDSATYMMGLNRQGGLRPAGHEWTWDTKRHQDCFWLGAVNAGLMVRLKDQNYRRPLVNIYYQFQPLRMPASWGNGGRGGVKVFEKGDAVIARSYSGPRTLRKGQSLDFVVDLYLTPFRTNDTDRQWSTRFVHPHPGRDPQVVDAALAAADPVHGPNVLTVHQATYYNPYINYPYSPDSFPAFEDLVKRAHEKGIRARVYYTTREITMNMPEMFALHSLNGEVVFPGPGKNAKTLINPNGPNPWLIENLGADFVPAWVDHVGGKYAALDISVITTPDSRWNNFYLEGLKWMVDKAKIDGVYIDDTALDALSLQRARRILATRPDPFTDLHTWNHFNEYAGYANNLNMYMEVLPYLDRLWLGEGFSANDAPWDYWLVEMSGLPFGLMSEMLDSPNASHGFTFGETGRLGWSGDPRPMWRLWDEYGMKGREMISFFDPGCPVTTSDPRVKATVYKGKNDTIVALANFAKEVVSVRLKIDWKALGIDPAHHVILTPAIEGIQKAGTGRPNDVIDVPAKSGAVRVLKLKGP